ncbi:MAG: DUF3822 family protein [Bacteroidales bacterium]|nr:DUF3822 family protein [Bacteroidales bacterium]
MDKFTIVPSPFFTKGDERSVLSQFVQLKPDDTVSYKELPQFEAVLVYAGAMPVVAELLESLLGIEEYNKVVITICNGILSLAVAAGDRLLLANNFEAADFTTALYYIFASLSHFQINPEMTTLYFKGELDYEHQEQLFGYFMGVEALS